MAKLKRTIEFTEYHRDWQQDEIQSMEWKYGFWKKCRGEGTRCRVSLGIPIARFHHL